MFIEALLTATRDRLATIRHDAPLIDAAKQLSRAKINLVVVCNDDETLSGVITKTDLVRQIGVCRGSACTAAASSVMTRDVTSCRRTSWLADVCSASATVDRSEAASSSVLCVFVRTWHAVRGCYRESMLTPRGDMHEQTILCPDPNIGRRPSCRGTVGNRWRPART